MGQGAMIHDHSRVTGLHRQRSDWSLSTAQGFDVCAQDSAHLRNKWALSPSERFPGKCGTFATINNKH